jgi:hypothetical protein
MNKGTFIRIMGGWVVFCATPGLSGCNRQMPPVAIAA